MVNLKDIQKKLDKLENNISRVEYLKELLSKVEDKKLKEDIKFLILSYEKVLEIEARNALKQEWSDEEIKIEEPQRRSLEKQIVSFNLRREERHEEVKYGISHSDITYAPHRLDQDPLRYKIMTSLVNDNLSFDEKLPVTPEQKHLIEERVRRYMPNVSEERVHQEVDSISDQFRYDAQR